MLYMLLPLLCGVVASTHLECAEWLSLLFIIPSTVVLFVALRRWAIYPLIVGVGMFVGSLNRVTHTPSMSYDHQYLLLVGDSRTAQVVAHRGCESESWQRCRFEVTTSGCSIEEHSAILCRATLSLYDRHGLQSNTYITSMCRRGYVANLSIDSYVELDPVQLSRHLPLSVRMNRWAVERLGRLELSDRAFASAAAMALAHRSQLDEGLKESYRLSGTSHILALSGLHFGVVLLIISSVTYLMPMVRNGHIVADVVSIIFIWLFACLVGMGESVLRAAWMFSMLHLASLISRRSNSLNSLLAASTLIILFDPAALFDVGFQLSFVSVLSIIVVGAPLAVRLFGRLLSPIKAVASSIVIGVVVTLATAPLLAYYFGGVSLIGPLATLPTLVTLMVVLFSSIIWIIAPLNIVAPIARALIECCTTLQNGIVERVASWSWVYYDLQISQLDMILAYLFMVTILLFVRVATSPSSRNDYPKR